MGRRSDHTREELRELALNAAQQIVQEEGWTALSARKITGKIGYTVGTLYNLYKNLDDVIIHINGRTLDALSQYLTDALKKSHAVEEKGIYALGMAYLDFSRTHYPLWAMLFEHRISEGGLPEWYNTKIHQLFALVEGTVQPLFGSNKEMASRTAKVLWAGLHGICTLSLSGKLETTKAEPAKVLAESLIDGYIKGITQ